MFDRIHKGLWWDKPWSLVEGCTPVSPACDHCWLQGMNQRFGRATEGVRPRADRLEMPLRRKKPTVWAIWSDLCHDAVPRSFIALAFAVMRRCPQHIFIVPTKRTRRMADFIAAQKPLRPLPNVILMTTVEDRPREDRVAELLRCRGWRLGLSCEPLLEYISLPPEFLLLRDRAWVICGGESGTQARPMHPDWARLLHDQCADAGVPFFFKQWGEYAPEPCCDDCTCVQGELCGEGRGKLVTDEEIMVRVGKKAAGRLLNGTTYLEVPDVL